MMGFRIGILLTIGALVLITFFYVQALRADNKQLKIDLALAISNKEEAIKAKNQAIEASTLAGQEAKRQAEKAVALNNQLKAYLEGDCDANDPACAVAYINRLLGEESTNQD